MIGGDHKQSTSKEQGEHCMGVALESHGVPISRREPTKCIKMRPKWMWARAIEARESSGAAAKRALVPYSDRTVPIVTVP